MNNRYLDNYVGAGIIAAIIVLLWLLASIFLSSQAEASRGPYTKFNSISDVGDVRRLSGVSTRVTALVWAAPRTPFERVNPPVAFVLQWPRLPSVAEQQIKIAEQRLAEYTARHAESVKEARRVRELLLDWEALQKAIALALLSLGTVITLTYWSLRKG